MVDKTFFRLTLVIALSFASLSANAATVTVDVTSMIDGESQIIIKDDSIQWHHLSWIVPGVSATNALDITPTTISYSIDGVLQQTANWYPSWPTPHWDAGVSNGSTNNWNRDNQLSDIFSGFLIPISSATSGFTLTPISRRGITSITELPSPANGNALVIDFNDAPIGGSAIYSSSISFTAAVPEADTSAMLLMGLGVMGFIARRRKQQLN